MGEAGKQWTERNEPTAHMFVRVLDGLVIDAVTKVVFSCRNGRNDKIKYMHTHKLLGGRQNFMV
jgi:hypothetical protein